MKQISNDKKEYLDEDSIVDDLTTGGTTVPLSAEQGKTLETNKAKASVTMTADNIVTGAGTNEIKDSSKAFETVITNSATKVPTSSAIVNYTGIDVFGSTFGIAALTAISFAVATYKYGVVAVGSPTIFTFSRAGTYWVSFNGESSITQVQFLKNSGAQFTNDQPAADLNLSYPYTFAINDTLEIKIASSAGGGGQVAINRIGD